MSPEKVVIYYWYLQTKATIFLEAFWNLHFWHLPDLRMRIMLFFSKKSVIFTFPIFPGMGEVEFCAADIPWQMKLSDDVISLVYLFSLVAVLALWITHKSRDESIVIAFSIASICQELLLLQVSVFSCRNLRFR